MLLAQSGGKLGVEIFVVGVRKLPHVITVVHAETIEAVHTRHTTLTVLRRRGECGCQLRASRAVRAPAAQSINLYITWHRETRCAGALVGGV